LTWGQWTLQATPDALTLHAEAANEEDLQRIQDLLAARLEKIGRRDHLTVTWQRPDAPTVHLGDPHPTEEPRRTANTARRWPLIAVVALFVAIHLGLGGAALAASPWTDWTAIGLVTIFLVKIIGLRLLATRRGKVSQAPRRVFDRLFRNHVGHENENRAGISRNGSDNTHP
jgi:hypothetical protein